MSYQFPPSSPIVGESRKDKAIQFKKDPIPKKLDFENVNLNIKNTVTTDHHIHYPTPLPSSSIGTLSSSPIKHTKPLNTLSSSPIKSSNTLISSFPLAEEPRLNNKLVIPIQLHPNEPVTYKLGRQSSSCDIALPKFKLISRNHAILSYTPQKNQLKLTCLGLNGLIVALPRHISCHLKKNHLNQFEFSSNDTLGIVDKERQLLKEEKNLTSFALMKGDTVILPFMNNTIIDFRNVEVLLTMKQLSYHDHLLHEEKWHKGKMIHMF